ncbi:alpha/beta hydrolase [Nocardia sp. NPDC048505]|uniref:alpha/beta hydrolase n=1 Tax=unclassified Nocardia TaxID=2637762 RepID=UPI0033C17CF1
MSIERADMVPLWPEQDALSSTGQETVLPEVAGHRNLRVIRNVTRPVCVVHPAAPGRATGSGVIVCPGGSFVTLTETATDVARKLAAQGITAFVLRYRLLPSAPSDADFQRRWGELSMDEIRAHSRVALRDAQQAVRVVRGRAADWGVDPQRVGMLGFSAGGLLTVGAATDPDPAARPDFAAPIYPPIWHEYRVPPAAPPLFLCLAADDPGENVLAGNLALHRDWLAAGRSVELHLYDRGGHGFAEGERGLPCDFWLDRYLDWQRAQGY